VGRKVDRKNINEVSIHFGKHLYNLPKIETNRKKSAVFWISRNFVIEKIRTFQKRKKKFKQI